MTQLEMQLAEHEQFQVARRRLGMGQTEVARRVGVAQSVVSRWERGINTPSAVVTESLWLVLRAEQLRQDRL